jgi:hypothetical protein
MHDGLKCPKTGEERKVPLLPEVLKKLTELVKETPHIAAADPFVFYGVLEDKPMDIQFLIDGLRAACREAGNNPAGWTVDLTAVAGEAAFPLWMIQGEKNAKGELQGTWSVPVRVFAENQSTAICVGHQRRNSHRNVRLPPGKSYAFILSDVARPANRPQRAGGTVETNRSRNGEAGGRIA